MKLEPQNELETQPLCENGLMVPTGLENGNCLTFLFKKEKVGLEVDKALEIDTLPRSPTAVCFFTAETSQTQEEVEQKCHVNY